MQSQPPQIHNPTDSVIIVGPNGPLTINTPVPEPQDFGEGRCPVCPSRAVTLAHPYCPCGFPIREWYVSHAVAIRRHQAFLGLCGIAVLCFLAGFAMYFRLQRTSLGLMMSTNSNEPFFWMFGFIFLMALVLGTIFYRARNQLRAIRLPQ